MKIKKIRDLLIRQSVFLFLLLSMLGGAIYYVDMLSSDYDTSINNMNAQIGAISSEAAMLTSSFEEVKGGLDLYKSIEKQIDDKKLTISKNDLKEVISDVLKDRDFSAIEVNVGEVKARDEPDYKMSSVTVDSSLVTIKLSAMTDIDVFFLARKIADSFAAIKYSNISLTFNAPLKDEQLLEIRSKGFSPIVKATLSFVWSGIRDNTPSEIDLLLKDNGKKVGAK